MLAIPVCAMPNCSLSASAARLPASIPAIMCGSRGSQRLQAMLAATVISATALT